MPKPNSTPPNHDILRALSDYVNSLLASSSKPVIHQHRLVVIDTVAAVHDLAAKKRFGSHRPHVAQDRHVELLNAAARAVLRRSNIPAYRRRDVMHWIADLRGQIIQSTAPYQL